MKKPIAAIAGSASIVLACGAALLVVDAGSAAPSSAELRQPARTITAPTEVGLQVELAAVPELSEEALTGIRKEGVRLTVVDAADVATTPGIVSRRKVLRPVLDEDGPFDRPELTEASLARVTVPDFGRHQGGDPNKPLDLVIEDRLVWVVTTHNEGPMMLLGSPTPKSRTEVKAQRKQEPRIVRASFVAFVDARTGKFLQGQSISVR